MEHGDVFLGHIILARMQFRDNTAVCVMVDIGVAFVFFGSEFNHFHNSFQNF
jgi:hypothetical protein